MIVVKSATKTMVTMVIRIELRIFETDSISAGNEAWDDYKLSKVQSRS